MKRLLSGIGPARSDPENRPTMEIDSMNKMLCRWLCIVSLLSGPTAGTGWAASNQDDASGSASGETIVGTTW